MELRNIKYIFELLFYVMENYDILKFMDDRHDLNISN